jgi:hypothetical protein
VLEVLGELLEQRSIAQVTHGCLSTRFSLGISTKFSSQARQLFCFGWKTREIQNLTQTSVGFSKFSLLTSQIFVV